MNELIRLLAILVFGNLGLVAFFVVVSALFPRRVGKTRAVADAMPGRAFAVGLVNFTFFSALTAAFTALGQWTHFPLLGIPALFFLALLGISLCFGLAGVVQLVGERMAPAQNEVRRTVWGALALGLGCSLPFVGWFGLLPYASLLGLGAFIISFFYRERSAPPI